MIYYYDNKRSISDWYIKLLRENIFTITIPGFFYQYSIMRFFLKRTFPFQSVKKGDNVLQVGSAAWTFDAGVSQTAMLSTLVGEKGNVIVFEPEKKNIEYHKKYCRRYGIKNIYVEPFGVWSDSGHLDFLIHQESDGGHVSEKIYHWRGGKDTNFKKTTIHVKTLSSYLDLKKIVPKLVNITVNAGEFNVLQGAEKSFKDIGNFTFPIFGPRKWYKDAIEMLIKSGYKVVLSDAPPTLRGRPVYRNQANKMRKNNPQRIVAFATKDISILPQKRLIPIEKLKRERQTYVFIQNHANTKNEKKIKG